MTPKLNLGLSTVTNKPLENKANDTNESANSTTTPIKVVATSRTTRNINNIHAKTNFITSTSNDSSMFLNFTPTAKSTTPFDDYWIIDDHSEEAHRASLIVGAGILPGILCLGWCCYCIPRLRIKPDVVVSKKKKDGDEWNKL